MNNPEQFKKIKHEVSQEIVKRYGHPVSFWEEFQIKNIVGIVMSEANMSGDDCLIYSAVAEKAEQIHERACTLIFPDEDNLKVRQLSGRVLGICCQANTTIG
jgi:hypothetical protein